MKAPRQRCPICENTVPAGAADRPFCSSRCSTADLGKWLGGNYRIAGPQVDVARELEREHECD